MAYDPSKDLLIWESPLSSTGTSIQIRSYNNGEAKIKFTKTFTKQNGETVVQAAYGLTLEDISYMGNFWEQIKAIVFQYKNAGQQGMPQQQNPGYQPGYNPMHQ